MKKSGRSGRGKNRERGKNRCVPIRTLSPALFVLICAAPCFAQNNSVGGSFAQAFLVPRIVYIGDPATLVVPLPPSPREKSDIVIDAKEHNLFMEDIDIHRIVLERRAGGDRLLVEFTAFTTGRLDLPIIEIDGESFGGLSVNISSLLDTSSAPQLSGAASTLAIPGTGTMLYGSMAGIVFFILISIWIFFRGRSVFAKFYEKWKRWNLFIYMKKTEKNLARLLLKGGDKREILDALSDEFRVFLSIYTGSNCRAMTAREFKSANAAAQGSAQTAQFNAAQGAARLDVSTQGVQLDIAFLGKFFRRCDDLRFCGAELKTESVNALLADFRGFIAEAEKKEKAA